MLAPPPSYLACLNGEAVTSVCFGSFDGWLIKPVEGMEHFIAPIAVNAFNLKVLRLIALTKEKTAPAAGIVL